MSRVGGDAQTKAMKQVARSLKIELANFEEMKSFSQFGSDLDASTLKILNHGEVLLQVLKQKQYEPYPLDKQVFILFMAKYLYLDDLAKDTIPLVLSKAYEYTKSTHKEILDSILENKEISEENETALHAVISEFLKMYKEEFIK